MMRTTRISRRTRSTILLFCILFTIFLTYWYLSDVNTHSHHSGSFMERHVQEPEFERGSHHDLLPIMSSKDTLNDLKRKEEQKMLRFESLLGKTGGPSDMITRKKTADEKKDEKEIMNFKEQLILRRQLERGVPQGGSVLLKFDNQTIPAFDLSKNYMHWQKELGTSSDIEASVEGVFPAKFRPEVGNGHIASVVFSNRLHMNNFFMGTGKKSRRVCLPTLIVRNITRVRVNYKELEPQSRRFSMNMATGIFKQTISGPGLVIEQRIYAHRRFSPLLVHEVDVSRGALLDRPSTKGALNVRLDFDSVVNDNPGDIVLKREIHPYIPGDLIKHLFGDHQEKEYPKSKKAQTTKVNMIYTELPEFLKATLDNSTRRVKWIFLLSVNEEESVALENFEVGSVLLGKGDWLYLTHLDAWRKIWTTGRVQASAAEPNLPLPNDLISAQYYIMSSLPWIPFEGYKFGGLSPCGLAHGGDEADHGFFGHVFWDQDLWVYPGILLLHSLIARQSMLQYRLDHLKAAQEVARKMGWKGAKYPWESAVTGLELTPDPANAHYQHHGTGAVALAAVNYILSTNDTDFLEKEGGKELLIEIAKFWKSRLTRVRIFDPKVDPAKKTKRKYRYEIWNAMGPDENHERVNNSAYTNAIARFCLEAPERIANFTGTQLHPSAKNFAAIAKKIYIPLSQQPEYHPEFDGYKIGNPIKQADTVLMGYPLHYAFDTLRRNDLTIYEKALSNGPGMSWAMHAIGWLELKDSGKAATAFKLQRMHIRPPFKVWSEYSSGGRPNFITAAGGFLQSILNGYFGFRLRTSGLYFDPSVPPGVADMNITSLDYLGNSLDFFVNDKGMQIRCSGHDANSPRLETEVINSSPHPLALSTEAWVELPLGRGVIRPMPNGAKWLNRPWSLRPLQIEKEIVNAVKSARETAAERLKKIMEFRSASRKRRRPPLKVEAEPLEKRVAKILRTQGGG